MKKYLLIMLILTNIDSKPISINDRKITILYTCNIEGRFEFDEDGREGLATIAEVKRREAEKVYIEKGGVLLLSRGNFFDIEKSLHIMQKSLFDGIIIEEEEINFLEKNPNLGKLKLPIISPRENLIGLDTEKIFDLDGIHVRVNSFLLNKLPKEKTKNIHLNLVFPDSSEEINFESIHPQIPVIFFLSKEKSTAYSFKSNVYTAECPEKRGLLGKIHLYFRGEKLIRQTQEMISLNKKDSNQNWIRPNMD